MGDPQYLALLDEMRALHLKKAADYGTDGDPLANLRGSVAIGIEPWRAAYLRALDKVRRINTFCVKGTLANEGVRDSFMDLAAYAILALKLFDEVSHAPVRHNPEPAALVAEPIKQPTFKELMEEARKLDVYSPCSIDIG